MSGTKSYSLRVQVTPELGAALEGVAARHDVPVAHVVRRALRMYLAGKAPEASVRDGLIQDLSSGAEPAVRANAGAAAGGEETVGSPSESAPEFIPRTPTGAPVRMNPAGEKRSFQPDPKGGKK